MTAEVEIGTIHATDIEELNYSVWPWDLRMNQLSPGRFEADLELAQVNGILLTHEHWSHRVSAIGATPSGYLALAGIRTEKPMTYAGAKIDAQTIMCGFDATDIEFATVDGNDHWVLLIPINLITSYLGDQLAAELVPRCRTFTSDPHAIRRLSSLAVHVITKLHNNGALRESDLMLNAIESQVMEAVTELLISADTNTAFATPLRRYLACRRALRYAEKLQRPISVNELAAQAGVSQRVLELGFKETINISPTRYLRCVRLNGLHRDLRHASRSQESVAEASVRWGFIELGRTAGEYRQLFGESPSTTLENDCRLDVRRYADALALPSNDA